MRWLSVRRTASGARSAEHAARVDRGQLVRVAHQDQLRSGSQGAHELLGQAMPIIDASSTITTAWGSGRFSCRRNRPRRVVARPPRNPSRRCSVDAPAACDGASSAIRLAARPVGAATAMDSAGMPRAPNACTSPAMRAVLPVPGPPEMRVSGRRSAAPIAADWLTVQDRPTARAAASTAARDRRRGAAPVRGGRVVPPKRRRAESPGENYARRKRNRPRRRRAGKRRDRRSETRRGVATGASADPAARRAGGRRWRPRRFGPDGRGAPRWPGGWRPRRALPAARGRAARWPAARRGEPFPQAPASRATCRPARRPRRVTRPLAQLWSEAVRSLIRFTSRPMSRPPHRWRRPAFRPAARPALDLGEARPPAEDGFRQTAHEQVQRPAESRFVAGLVADVQHATERQRVELLLQPIVGVDVGDDARRRPARQAIRLPVAEVGPAFVLEDHVDEAFDEASIGTAGRLGKREQEFQLARHPARAGQTAERAAHDGQGRGERRVGEPGGGGQLSGVASVLAEQRFQQRPHLRPFGPFRGGGAIRARSPSGTCSSRSWRKMPARAPPGRTSAASTGAGSIAPAAAASSSTSVGGR